MIATALTIGIPGLMILFGILLNRNDFNRLDARITAVEGSLRAEIAASRKQAHDDIMTLVNLSREYESRLTRLESRS